MHPKAIISLMLGITLSVAGFYLAFRHVPLDSLVIYARSVDYGWVFMALVVLVLIFVLRSQRWRLLLRPIGSISLSMAYHTIIISFMINCILPGRMGEMARPVILKKKEGFAFTSALATLAAERLLDLGTLLALLVMAMPGVSLSSAHPVVFGSYELSADLLMHLSRTSAIALVALVFGLALIVHDGIRTRLINLMGYLADGLRGMIPSSHHRRVDIVEDHIRALLERFADGLRYLKSPLNLLTAILFSILIWLLIALSFYLVARGSPGIDLNFAAILVMMVIICLFIALPAVPGYWGLWEAAGVFALYLFGVSNEPAAGFTLFNHAIQILPLIPAGWISCLLLGLGWSDIRNRRLSVESSDKGA